MASASPNAVPSNKQPPSLPNEADVVVIGGGAIGASLLYHLGRDHGFGTQKEGPKKSAVLLEKHQATSGTTWHSAGLVWRLRSTDVETYLINHTRDLAVNILEKETGVDCGWAANGGLFPALNEQRLADLKRFATLGKFFGIESSMLSPEESKQLYPGLHVDDVLASLYSPGDGTIEPANIVTAYLKGAKQHGSQVFENCGVKGFTTSEDGRVTGVITESGHVIKTNKVVNCAGVWGRKIGKLAGVKVPLVPMRHAYIVTDAISGISKIPNMRDHEASVYIKRQGESLQVGGYEMNPIFWDDVSDDFAFSLFDLDWDVFESHVRGSVNRLPLIGELGTKSTVCGPESFTPDHKPLMGEVPELRGFYLGCGFNSAGIMLSGGCGRELANMVMDKPTNVDMFSYDIRRFHPSLTDNEKWLRERSHEAYAKNYSILYPFDQPLSSRNMRKSPVHDRLVDAGCVFGEAHGWERPTWFAGKDKKEQAKTLPYDWYGAYPDTPAHKENGYADRLAGEYTWSWPEAHSAIAAEHKACREAAVSFDQSAFGKFLLTGPDAGKALEWLCTNSVQDKKPGQGMYTNMCNSKGGIECDLTIHNVGTDFVLPVTSTTSGTHNQYYIVAAGLLATHDFQYIKNMIQDNKWDCKLHDHTEEMGVMGLQGRLSREILHALVPEEEKTLFSDIKNFPFSSNRIINVAGHKVRAIRITFAGELGWELHIPREYALKVYDSVFEYGAKRGLVNAGYRALDSLSLEKGYKHWHADIRVTDTPIEAGLGFICKLKGNTPFLGREVLEQQKRDGVKSRLICLTTDKRHGPMYGNEVIYRNDKIVGFTRRAGFGHTIDRSILYGYITKDNDGGGVVDTAYVNEGEYQIEAMGKMMPAQLHAKCPVDPDNLRVKGQYDALPRL